MNQELLNKFIRVMVGASLVVSMAGATTPADSGSEAKVIPLEAASMIIEYNSSAEDIGIQFFLDSDGWESVEIFAPNGDLIFSADTHGSVARQGGGTELFLESVEPEIGDLPFGRFFRRFPEGTYRFRARDIDGNILRGRAEFTHDIPAGPELITPVPTGNAECARRVPLPILIAWEPVTTSRVGKPLKIVGYELIVENDDDLTFDAKFPADILELTVPDGLLKPGSDCIFKVLAIEESGNQTISEGCFRTAR